MIATLLVGVTFIFTFAHGSVSRTYGEYLAACSNNKCEPVFHVKENTYYYIKSNNDDVNQEFVDSLGDSTGTIALFDIGKLHPQYTYSPKSCNLTCSVTYYKNGKVASKGSMSYAQIRKALCGSECLGSTLNSTSQCHDIRRGKALKHYRRVSQRVVSHECTIKLKHTYYREFLPSMTSPCIFKDLEVTCLRCKQIKAAYHNNHINYSVPIADVDSYPISDCNDKHTEAKLVVPENKYNLMTYSTSGYGTDDICSGNEKDISVTGRKCYNQVIFSNVTLAAITGGHQMSDVVTWKNVDFTYSISSHFKNRHNMSVLENAISHQIKYLFRVLANYGTPVKDPIPRSLRWFSGIVSLFSVLLTAAFLIWYFVRVVIWSFKRYCMKENTSNLGSEPELPIQAKPAIAFKLPLVSKFGREKAKSTDDVHHVTNNRAFRYENSDL